MKQRYDLLKKGILFLTAILMTQFIYAQEKTITGIVTDDSNGEPIPGVTIIVKGSTSIGTITQYDGKYSIDVPEDATTLVYSFVGMVTQEVEIGANSVIDVILQEDVLGLDEVVVIGYGTQKKSDATGSLTTIGIDDFNQGSITSPQQLLVGRTAGVQITPTSGAPGEGATIRIRGGSSLTASNDPLIVIDGIPVNNDDISGMRNPLNIVNPNDIETFTVLKDASATAIYGSRASNGVIIITTKKGRKGSEFKISYSNKTSISTIANRIEVLSADEYRTLVQEKVDDGTIPDTAVYLLGNANTDWQNQVYETAVGTDHNVSATGSYMNIPYRASVGYSDQNGTLKGDNMKRMTGAISLNPTFLEDHLKVDLNFKGMNIKNTFANRDAIGSAIAFDPTQPVYDETSPYGGYFTWLSSDGSGYPNTLSPSNPVAQLALRDDESDVNRIITNAKIDYKLHYLPELTATVNVGYDHSKSNGIYYEPEYASWAFNSQPDQDGGTDKEYEQEKKNELLDMYITYNKAIDAFASNINVMGGYSWQHFWKSNYTFETNDYTSEDRRVNVTDDEDATEFYLISFFGRINYSLLDRYLFTYTLRRDGSSRFSPDTRWGLFPSYAFAWKIKEESFLQDVDFVSDLKLRLGYGVTGQQDISNNDYPYLASYVYSENDARYIFGNDTIRTARPSRYDANIKWEETTTINAGLDFGIMQERIIGSIDIYKRETKDLINEIPVPAGTNFSNRVVTNVGTLENKGVELSLTGRPIVKKDMYWEIGFNFTMNKNEITKLTVVDDSTFLGVPTGGIAGGVGNNIQIHSVGYPTNSFFVYEQIYDQNGDPIEGLYVDRSGDGLITEDDRYHYKKPDPDFTIGFNTRFEYMNWDLSCAGRASFGNYVYNNVNSSRAVYSNLFHSTYYMQNVTTDIYNTGFSNPQLFSDYYVQNASFLRMDNITLGYNFNDIVLEKMDIRVYATIQNAFVITKYEGIDPEVRKESGKPGIDDNIYPFPRIFMLGVNVDF